VGIVAIVEKASGAYLPSAMNRWMMLMACHRTRDHPAEAIQTTDWEGSDRGPGRAGRRWGDGGAGGGSGAEGGDGLRGRCERVQSGYVQW
jgi:hypothetical protein